MSGTGTAKAPAGGPKGPPSGGTRPKPAQAPVVSIKPVAGPAQPRRRHWGLLASLVLLVVAPVLVSAWYLWTRAVDQYASTTAFTVRREEVTSPTELLGGLSNFTGSSSSDTDILYEFIQSQELVRAIDDQVGLREIYTRPWPGDPIFGLAPEGTIEDLLDHWQRMVRISYDASTGLIELRVLAFVPEEARTIAQTIVQNSQEMINELSAIAREDAMRYAREELDQAVERLKAAREAMTAFRSRTQIVDPAADIQGQMGLLATLQEQLAATLIELDLLRETTQTTDPRVSQAERRIAVIQGRIAEERRKFGAGGQGPGGADYATVFSEFERLGVDLDFAQRTYTAALTAYDAARAEADRQSRYLAAFIRPTAAERSDYPRRPAILGLVALFGFLAWAVASLVFYSLRDRG
jgi:capsular polysaccharide transport system permease protein